MFMALVGAFQALLGRYARQDDVVVGMPIAGRTRTEIVEQRIVHEQWRAIAERSPMRPSH